MKHHIIATIFCLLVLSCGTSVKLWTSGDTHPPTLINVGVVDATSVQLEFDESVSINTLSIQHYSSQNNLPITFVQVEPQMLLIYFEEALLPGEQYTLSIHASDNNHNSALILSPIFGHNPNPPKLLINEFLCEGSSTRPDKVEILVTKSGLLSGFAIQQGGLDTYSKRIILPQIEVKEYDFIIVHWRPSDDEPFSTEIEHKSESNHFQAYDNAWDVFALEEGGLSNTNGSISIINMIDNTIMDAVVYSVKTDDLTHKYKGFGSSKSYIWASEIYHASAWNVDTLSSGILPSDTLNPKDSTTTRSIGRNSQSTDTDHKQDWHISPSRMSSFGEINTDEIYTP